MSVASFFFGRFGKIGHHTCSIHLRLPGPLLILRIEKDTHINDEDIRRWMMEKSPEAFRDMVTTFLEATFALTVEVIIIMLPQDGHTGSAWGDWSLYADSPFRAC